MLQNPRLKSKIEAIDSLRSVAHKPTAGKRAAGVEPEWMPPPSVLSVPIDNMTQDKNLWQCALRRCSG
jgi:hypothetical protein